MSVYRESTKRSKNGRDELLVSVLARGPCYRSVRKGELTLLRSDFFHLGIKNVVIICSRALYDLKAGFHFKL